MLEVFAHKYINLGRRIQAAKIALIIKDDDEELTPDVKKRMRKYLKEILELCNDIELPVSKELFSGLINDLPQSHRELEIAVKAVTSELQTKLFLFIPPHRAAYYESDSIVNDDVQTEFPNASIEMRIAGNCYAASLSTACVFHCMRALEHGLKALAADVGLSFDIQNWQNIIDQIEAEIAKLRGSLPRGTAKNERLQFLSEAAAEFAHFKDGWRNYVSHNRATYEEAQALNVMSHVQTFFATLATRLKE
ncbi:MAG: hypothetical protein IIA00_10025 [Proteobacteria bacterium]|nr:hypothetical protein [Pseudomonadota bacterium]